MRMRPSGLFAVLLAGCEGRGALISVANQSGRALENIVVSGRGFTDTIARLAPGQTSQVLVHPRGESGVSVSFSAADRRVVVPAQGYLDDCCGFSARLTINPALKADFDLRLDRR